MRAAFLAGVERRPVKRKSMRICGNCGKKVWRWPRLEEGLRLGPCCSERFGPGLRR